MKSRSDLSKALDDLVSPLLSHRSHRGAKIDLYSTGAHYQDSAIGLEGFSRALFGITPYILGGFEKREFYLQWMFEGLQAGASPESPDYWGPPLFYITSFIEMGAIAFSLLSLSQEDIEKIPPQSRQHLIEWMILIRDFDDFKNNNQLFFRLFAFLALRKLDSSLISQDAVFEVLEKIDRSYLSHGWYNDALATDERRSIDYYNSMGFHYYGLIYSQMVKDQPNEYSERFRQRAVRFAQDFIYWFDQRGRAIPFGRSLAYRSAQCAFWAALAHADLEAIPWGQIKYLVLSNLRHWLSRPAFSETGLLSIGYEYPNLNMAEEYNSPTSPYWALKPFLVLSLAEESAFWQAKEEPPVKTRTVSIQKHGRHLFHESKDSGHLFMLNGGNWRKSCFQHIEEKFAKFAYSTHFGFNVSTGNGRIEKRAPDNTLLLTDDGYYFKERGKTFDHEVTDEYLASSFSPWSEVKIRTWLCVLGETPWHLRIHQIQSDRELTCYEGGFALPRSDHNYSAYGGGQSGQLLGCVEKDLEPGNAMIGEQTGLSSIYDPSGYRQGSIVMHAPNSNLIHRRAVIPVLKASIPKGESVFASVVLAHPELPDGRRFWDERPSFEEIQKLLPERLRGIFQSSERNHYDSV